LAELTSILRDVRGIYTDRGRDRLPEGSVWELIDYVPEILQAGARMRGSWLYQSDALPAAPDGQIYAPYRAAAKLLVAAGTGLRVVPTDSIGSTAVGTIPVTQQNPVFHRDRVIIPAADGTSAARFITFNGASYVLADAPPSALTGRYATAWKDRLVLANSNAFPFQIAYSKVGDPTVAWDTLSKVDTSFDITGLASMRTQVLAFHSSSVERLRGTTPPDSTLSDQTGDLILDSLFDKAGCYDARSIAYWNENVIFCDSRGIHLTDGALVRNLTLQAGMLNAWRANWERPTPPLTSGGVVHRDYYIVTVRHSGQTPTTFVVDLPTRRMFMLANCDCSCFAAASGVTERLFGTDQATLRVTDMTPVFDPDSTILQVDANGVPVLPVIATGWHMLSKEPSFKRIEDVHLSYEAYVTAGDPEVLRIGYINAPNGVSQTLGEFKSTTKYSRKKIAVRRRLQGVGFKITQLVPTKDTRLYDLSVRAYAEEDTRL
jgi:hypothetical protein